MSLFLIIYKLVSVLPVTVQSQNIYFLILVTFIIVNNSLIIVNIFVEKNSNICLFSYV